MKRACSILPLFVALSILLNETLFAQTGKGKPRLGESEPGVVAGHTLFGDFVIEREKSAGSKPVVYHLILYAVSGPVVARQSISNNGRYRFNDLRNGEYNLVVELDNSEVARIYLRIAEVSKTDIRRDISLEWRGGAEASKIGTVNVTNSYDRNAENQARFDKALEAFKKKDHSGAISLLRQIVESDPQDFLAWTELGTAYFMKGSSEDAESAYSKAIELSPSFLLALLNLGKLRVGQKEFDGAIEVLARAVAADPRSADANFFLGEAYLQVKKGSKAVVYFNEALKLDPVGKAEAHLRMGMLYRAAGLKERAAAEFQQFLAKRPDYPDKKKLQQYIEEGQKK